jgi:hypothetical protein
MVVTLAFALQLRKKHRKTSVSHVMNDSVKCCDKVVLYVWVSYSVSNFLSRYRYFQKKDFAAWICGYVDGRVL